MCRDVPRGWRLRHITWSLPSRSSQPSQGQSCSADVTYNTVSRTSNSPGIHHGQEAGSGELGRGRKKLRKFLAELESCMGVSPGYGRSGNKRTQNRLMCIKVLKGE